MKTRRDLKSMAWSCLIAICGVWTAHGQDRIADTVHNLSASGPGEVRAVSEQQVCIFCHAPHNTSGVPPLWNRELPVSSYQIYTSSTLDANPGQPTGASKLCLSCHDGTIALGSVLSRADRIRMVGGDFLPAGLANLGTDLSDDHPVSFFYTSGLAASDQQLADPQSLPPEVNLDAQGQLQCTACHDPHSNMFGQFLVMSNLYGALCQACHLMEGWTSSSHQASGAVVTGSTTVDWPYLTVEENACRSCHRSHTAGGRERLLIFENEEDNCLECHNGQVASTNILSEINKFSAHDPRRYLQVHDPAEPASGAGTHVECQDCHNAHAAVAQPGPGGYIPIGGTMTGVPGVTVGGMPLDEADHEYEVCFRCHGDNAVPISQQIVRQAHTSNLRLEFNPSNPSFHPVVAPSPSSDTVSLAPGFPSGSLIRCTACHNNDTGRRAGGSGPDGPHGSINSFLLERNYTVVDDTPESQYDYAMCYKCHRRPSILNDESFNKHKRHIQDNNTPCSVCHDPHGVSELGPPTSDYTHLINFDTTVVFPEPETGRLEFQDFGTYQGSCTLRCHGHDHRDRNYQQ
ncbi:MAG: hypothetical protein JSU86_18370 [Phycisphaerales bacterium]|nr:MAG: hypothetical protein JSU86_18370 [Phycisphaerales bacterium]